MAVDLTTQRADGTGRSPRIRALEMLSRARFVGGAVAAGMIAAACVSASSNSPAPDAGVDGDASVADAGGHENPGDAARADSGSPADAAPADAEVPDDASTPDAAPVDPFEGVWVGQQLGATVEFSNAAGCMLIKGSASGVVCDECEGSYVAVDGGSANVVAHCVPRGACSVSPAHTDTGTFSFVDGGGLSFVYDYGGGTSSVEVQRTQGAPGDVCQTIDAGHVIDAGAGD